MDRDTSPLTSHVRVSCVLILLLSAVHAEASFWQKSWPEEVSMADGFSCSLGGSPPVDNRESVGKFETQCMSVLLAETSPLPSWMRCKQL